MSGKSVHHYEQTLRKHGIFKGNGDTLIGIIPRILQFSTPKLADDIVEAFSEITNLFDKRGDNAGNFSLIVNNEKELDRLKYLDKRVVIDELRILGFVPRYLKGFLNDITLNILLPDIPHFDDIQIKYVGNITFQKGEAKKISDNLAESNIEILSKNNLSLRFTGYITQNFKFSISDECPNVFLNFVDCKESQVNISNFNGLELSIFANTGISTYLESISVNRLLIATSGATFLENSIGSISEEVPRIVLSGEVGRDNSIPGLNLTNCENYEVFAGSTAKPFMHYHSCKNISLQISNSTGQIYINNSNFTFIKNSYIGHEISIAKIESEGSCQVDDLDLGNINFLGPLYLQNIVFKDTPDLTGSKLPEIVKFSHKSFEDITFNKGREPFNYLKNHYESKDIEEDAMFFTRLSYVAREKDDNFKKYKLISWIYGLLTDYGTSLYRSLSTWFFISFFVFLPLQFLLQHIYGEAYLSSLSSNSPIWIKNNMGPLFISTIDMLGPLGYLFSVDKYLNKPLLVVIVSFSHRMISSFYIYFFIMWFKKIFRQK